MMIGAPLVMESASWALWFWQHRHEFAPVLQKLAEGTHWMETFLADPLGAVRRVGNLLVFGGVGQGTILAFLDPFSNQAEAASASTGESSVPLTLASLQGASTVALGLAALTPLALTTQFVVLSRRLAELQKQIAELSRKFDVDKSTKLKAGLDLLESGTQLSHKDRSAGRDRLNRALERCVDSMHYYSALLGNELANPTINRAAVRLEARHLALNNSAQFSCTVESRSF